LALKWRLGQTGKDGTLQMHGSERKRRVHHRDKRLESGRRRDKPHQKKVLTQSNPMWQGETKQYRRQDKNQIEEVQGAGQQLLEGFKRKNFCERGGKKSLSKGGMAAAPSTDSSYLK